MGDNEIIVPFKVQDDFYLDVRLTVRSEFSRMRVKIFHIKDQSFLE